MTEIQSKTNTPGPLRSESVITVNTYHASRLWKGRRQIKENGKITQAMIISMPHCLGILSRIHRDAQNDDPYADDYLIKFEQKLQANRKEMQELIDKIIKLYEKNVPSTFNMEGSVSTEPVNYPLEFNSQIGYQLIFLFLGFDELACSVMTASHIALITRRESHDWINSGAKLLRQCFAIVERYKTSGITRADAVQNNARYQAAIKRMGYTLSDEVLSGSVRAEFAPVIRKQQSAVDKTVDDE
ncbi:PFL_4669 family integrating conjugative element protein [Phocoenobacter skyensis]|uniref:PFL_4669 family integrating conjugative element protein n=1 Tax=Phocoenobacter skyensis TaxID=97481 RepID=UPI002775E644|nr:TIGR03761 family integrating conjugative element protein [Pasteurella skyensis]MDP8185284.1 TIGR03761 family integrating conjugative element protein [Pasteurella skyensis]